MPAANDILTTYLHFRDDGRAGTVPVDGAFWQDLAAGKHAALDRGRLMTAFSFAEPWATWERHPAGEELGLLLSGAATLVLDQADGTHAIELTAPGAYVLIPINVWHTARTTAPCTMLFLTPGAGTEHRPIED